MNKFEMPVNQVMNMPLGLGHFNDAVVSLSKDVNVMSLFWIGTTENLSCVLKVNDKEAMIFAFHVDLISTSKVHLTYCTKSIDYYKCHVALIENVDVKHTSVDDHSRSDVEIDFEEAKVKYEVFKDVIEKLFKVGYILC